MNAIKTSFYGTILGFTLVGLFTGCTTETETRTLTTTALQMHAEGPFFEGPNTATVSWEFDLQEYTEGEISTADIHKASITEIAVTLKPGEELPNIERIVVETKSASTSMNRVGMLERKIEVDETYTFKIAEVQKQVAEALQDERITFVADFDLVDEEFYDDIDFELRVTFDVQVKK